MIEQGVELKKLEHLEPPAMYERTQTHTHRLELTLDGEPVGYADLEYFNKPFPLYYLSILKIFKDRRGQGAGSYVIEQLNNFLDSKGKAGILGDTMRASNPAKGIYSRHGWVPVEGKDDWLTYNLPKNIDAENVRKAIIKLDGYF